MKRLQIAQIIALVATVASVIGWILYSKHIAFGAILLAIGCILGLASYLFGGFLNAVKMSWSIAKWGWVIAPFPMNLVVGGVTFFFALMAFAFIPIIPVRKTYLERMQ